MHSRMPRPPMPVPGILIHKEPYCVTGGGREGERNEESKSHKGGRSLPT